ncbi:Rap30/74 interaction domain-containing protein [Metschnikowia bicuspidata var. bicuspidata NRRL YB-4993]|uniref:Transcription initiation factor IIF subunit alpha n=1 Tax=Metschnikowia bicuspidata var. bicuspidata NRRL YB-4993 TaxID=869754 RepID=A0A1A0HEB9_9ASCO|nr:Rap30/74 interaction domain-containing protein [Metschnikowia bicuspidata var. bicuspidata NRRL YB-4993]OBA22247.1 Rap30/74 interaction domain-containing protein [Metschnikowia bicuspidata var. bicuspidata NRRL YB-4993]
MSEPTIKSEPVIKQEPGVGAPSPNRILTSAALASNGGSSSPSSEWNVIPLKACTTEELQDTRHHILKFHTKQDVDVMKNFNKPVRMHRKDPQNIQFQLSRKEMDRRRREKVAAKAAADAELDLENEENNPNHLNGKASDSHGNGQQSADMSQVAPDGGARRHRRNLFKRKTKQVHMMDETKRKLRYEEYYPWVIEDYTGDNVFVGSYEAGSTESTHVLFVFDKNCFKMVPAEKVYKFTPRNKYATLTLEEAEARMEKNLSAPRWLMKHMDEGSERSDMRFRRGGAEAGSSSNLQTRLNRMRTVQGGIQDRDSDHDDLDFEEEFADDEEAPIMDGDEEENKLLEKKIKKEMLKAAHFDGQLDGGDDSDDLNDLFEVEKSRKVDKEGKKLKKVLNKTEGAVYESDNEESNPYVSQSDLESNDDSEPEANIKTEPVDGELGREEPRARTVYISRINNSTIVINATKDFLRQFPHGEWNPNAKKRLQSFESPSPTKKIKCEESSPLVPGLVPSNSSDLGYSGLNGELVTTLEVLDIVRQNPLTTKELLLNLRSRIGTHKDNKTRIIQIVKQNLRLADGKLQLKE